MLLDELRSDLNLLYSIISVNAFLVVEDQLDQIIVKNKPS